MDWSSIYAHRKAAEKRFGRIFDVPIVKRVRDPLLDAISDGARVLEVGAGDRSMGRAVCAARKNVEYRSMDIDRRTEQDFYTLDDVPPGFDCVYAFEVVEHLTLAEITVWLPRLAELLKPGGKLLLSTPNTYYPPAFLRDVTHKTPLCYDELAGLAAAAGLNVARIVRVYNDPLHRMLLRRYLFGWLFKMIGIDFAKQIVLLAEKPA